MEKTLIIRKVSIIVSLFLLLSSGCATHRRPETMNSQEIGELKTKLGLIGVTGARDVPRVEVKTPSKGAEEGAKDGAKVGALTPFAMSFEAMQECGDPYCLLLPFAGLALAPVGAIVGSVGGAITADAAETVTAREVKVKDALATLRMQENIHEKFVSRLSELKSFPFTIIYEAGPTIEGEKPDYRQFKSSGISSVNEIDVRKLTLSGWGKVRPDLYVQLEVQVRLISLTDNTEIFCRIFTCSSKDAKFEVWAAEDAKKFREEIESCYNDVADWAVNDIYVNNTIIGMRKELTMPLRPLTRQSIADCQ